MRIEQIDKTSPYLEAVIRLWRANSATLGFFPTGAFEEYAQNRGILVACDDQGFCLGYLLYRCSRCRIVTIHHLCVDAQSRGRGVASRLLDQLKALTGDELGIRLSCRRDFEANRSWPTQGFVAQSNRPGRAQDGKELTVWWYDHGHPNLFTLAAKEQSGAKLRAAIDANVFIDLQQEDGAEESKALLADWLDDSIELWVTPELLNELNGNDDPSIREHMRSLASGYPVIAYDSKQFERVHDSVRHYSLGRLNDRDKADLRQLAWTVGSNDVRFFVTRDNHLLNRLADSIYDDFGVSIVSPAGLICQLDELRREAEYQPRRLAGSLSTIRRVQVDDIAGVNRCFQLPELHETKAEFQRQLDQCLMDPEKHICQLARNREGEPLALVVYDVGTPHELRVPMLRVTRDSLATTLIRYLTLRAVADSSQQHRDCTIITDPYLSEDVIAALQEDFFFQVEYGWLKVNLPVMKDASSLAEHLTSICTSHGWEVSQLSELARLLDQADLVNDIQTATGIERALWPAKIRDASIPTFLVPIKAYWAQHLFDENLASQTLFGAETTLALNRENVYYRSKRFSGGLAAPSRILWYVSRSSGYSGSMQVRACSTLDEVVVGSPKELYRQFRRLGVYEWHNVYDLAKEDIKTDIMALRFSDTELFPSPVPLDRLRSILAETGHRPNLQSPLRLNAGAFAAIYSAGQQPITRRAHGS